MPAAKTLMRGAKLNSAECDHVNHMLTVHSNLSDSKISSTVDNLKQGKTPPTLAAVHGAMSRGAKTMPAGSPHQKLHNGAVAKIATHIAHASSN